MKYGLVLKKTMAIMLSALIVVMMVPLSALLALAGDSTPLVTYDTPAEAVNAVIGETKGDAMLDYSNATYAFSGSLYGAAWNTASDKAIRTYVENDGGWTMAYTDAASWGHLSNNSFIYYSGSNYSGAIGVRLSEASGYIKISFVAPENGKYHLNPLGITAAGGKSMLLSKGNNGGTDLEHYNQTLTITKGSTDLFSKTLTLGDGYADAADDLPSDLTVELAKGESLDFTFTTSADWDITHLFVNFEMQLMERTAAKVESVSFPSANYIVEKADTTLNISPVVLPSNAADKTVTYTVEDSDVLSVDNSGNVTPKAAGYTKVTATTTDGQKTAETLICVYDSTTSSIYNVKDYYDAADTLLSEYTTETGISNTVATSWQPVYKSGDSWVKSEKIFKDMWGGSNYAIVALPDAAPDIAAGSDANNAWSFISMNRAGGVFTTNLNNGKDESTYVRGAALMFTAPQKGVYSFTSDSKINLASTTIEYMGWEPDVPLSVNFCLNGQELTSVTLTAATTEVDFPKINAVAMAEGDIFTVEIDTELYQKAQVNIDPKAIWVYEKAPDKPVTGVSLDADSITVEKGATKALVATVLPATATNKDVTFESSDETVATVDASGIVTGVASGTATITVKSVSNPEITDTCTVKVPYTTQTFASSLFNDGTAVTSSIAKGDTTAMVYGTAFTAGTLNSDGKYADFPLVTKQDWGANTPPLFKTDEMHESNPVQSLSIYDNGSGVSLNSYKDNESVYVGYTAQENGKYDIYPSSGIGAITLNPNLNGGVTVNDLISWGFDKPMYVRITVNGQKIWPVDSDGVELKLSGTTSVTFPTLSDVQMYKGDKLRVEFTSVGDVDRRLSVGVDFAVQLQDKTVAQKPVTGVAFTEKTASFFMGEQYQLSAGVVPADADNKNIRYTSSDTGVAVVDSNGLVTGISVGTATIYAISCDDETIKDTCTVTVKHSYPAHNASGELKQSVHDVIASEDAAVATPFSFQNGFVAGYTDKDGLYTDFPYALRVKWGENTAPVIFTNDSAETGTQAANQMIIIDGDYMSVSSFTANSWVYAGYRAEVDGKYKIFGSSSLSDIMLQIGGCTEDDFLSWGQNKPWYVRITKNGQQIWPAGNEAYEMFAVGANTVAFPELNDIVLYKGDTVRIEVQGPENIDRHAKLHTDFDVKLMETIAVTNPVTGIAFQNSSYTVLENESLALVVSILPDNADNKNVVFTSSDDTVVTVNSAGVVTGQKKGTATVYATSVENGAIVGSCTVNVKKSYPKVNVLDTIWPEMLAAAPNEGEIVSVTQNGSFTTGTLDKDGNYLDFPYVMRKNWGNPRCVYLSNDSTVTDLETALQSIRFAEDRALIGSYVENEWVYLGFTAKENGKYTIDGADDFQNIELSTNRCTIDALIEYGHNKPAYVRITLNGKQIWPTDGNAYELLMTGVSAVEFPKLTGIDMYKGDNLRLEVSLPANIDRHLVVNTDFDVQMEEPISVTTPVTGVQFENAVNTVYQGETLKLSAAVIPADANNQNLVYSSSDPSVASVNAAGVVAAHNVGEVTIYATSMEDPNIKGACTVVVKKSYLPQNAVETLWNSALDIAKNEKELKNAQYNDSFVAGIVDGDAYVEFPYVLRQSWGSPRAVLYTANSDEDGSTVSKQYISIYSNMAVAGSYVDGQSVYVGYKVKDNGVYKISPAEGFANITMSIANNYTVEDLQKWQEDKPTYVRITVNGEKIWPTDSDAFMLLPSGDMSVAFPTIEGMKLYKGDLVCLEVSGQAGVNRHTSVNFSFNMQKQDELAVNVPVTGVAFGETSAVLSQYESRKILASVTPANADNKNVVYISSNPEIASVNSAGIVTAHQVGTATITATSVENENLKTSCTIVVKKSYLPENVVEELWDAVLDTATEEMKLERFAFNGSFLSGVLDNDGIYNDFAFALRQNWGNPRAGVLTNNASEDGGMTSTQYLSIYENKANIASYVNDQWVYLGFKAPHNGYYTISAAEGFENIELKISGKYTLADLKEWGEDTKPTYVRITLNGKQIWPEGTEGYKLTAAGPSSVAFPTIEGVKMYKGDKLRLEVSGQDGVNRHTSIITNFDVKLTDEFSSSVPVSGITLTDSAVELSINQVYGLKAAVSPANADNKNIRYESSNTDIAVVDSLGRITALSSGNATIYAISEDNESAMAACAVTVTNFIIRDFSPDELKADMDSQLDGAEVVTTKEIEYNQNWTPQYTLDGKNWNTIGTLNTTIYDNNKAGDLSAYSFKWTNKDSIGLEKYYGNYQPFLTTEDTTVALTFTATLAGTYAISGDERSPLIHLPATYLNGRVEKEDENKEWTFVIYHNDKEIYSVGLSVKNNSVSFPTIEGIKMNAKDTLRFALIDNPEAKSQMTVYFYPKVSVVSPDKTENAPIVDSKLHILEPNVVYNGKLGAIHPNGLDIKYQVMDKGVGELKVDAGGKITYTPKKDWKGLDTFRIKCYDERDRFAIATITFMVSVKFDSVKDMTANCLSMDEKKTGKSVPLSWPKVGWKYQYTYDGLTYTNGAPQYMDTNTVEVIQNPGWWGYTMFSSGMPQATIQAVDGTAAITVMAGHEPWGVNPVGAVSFIAPYGATYMLKGNDLFNKFKLAVDPDDENYKRPIKVWITKNGEKIWPAEADYLEISKDQIEIEFPELTVAMNEGDSLRVCVSGHVDNLRYNRINVAPVVYDIGEYQASLDPHSEPEAGVVITDDDGEPMVKYASVSYDSRHIKLLKNNFAEPVIGKGLTKNGITSIKHVDNFTCEVKYKATDGASQYRVLVYRMTDDGYELVYDEISDALSAEIRGLDEGRHLVQVVALDRLGQYLEIYTAREFTVGADGKISASAFVSIWVIIPAAVVVLALAATVWFIILKRKRKNGGEPVPEEDAAQPAAQDETDA